ncbi:MAG: hypothetical protein HY313_11205 [Acidobacteria bacterium]|nr:hypothetical protein [Acidobacteriota bacterium]
MRREKLLLARGAAEASEQPRLDLLIPLTADPDEAVRQAALETINRLGNDYCAQALASPSMPEFVLCYFLDPAHLRPQLLPVLLANPSSPSEAINTLASSAGPEVIPLLLEHLDLLKTSALAALKANPAYLHWEKKSAIAALPEEEKLAAARGDRELPLEQRLSTLVLLASDANSEVRRAAESTLGRVEEVRCAELLADPSLEEPVARYFLEPGHIRPAMLPVLLAHPASPPDAITALIAQAGPNIIPVLLDNLDLLKTSALIALKDNPAYLHWQKEPPTQGIVVEVDLLELLIAEAEAEELQEFHAELTEEEQKEPEGGIYSKISKMGVAQRVKLALLGSREERALLIRDSSRSVCRAVLSSPKLTDTEIESFSGMKNISQEVLRLISMNRKFMKNYTVVKNLVNNPRLPIDVGLPLLHRLIINDLFGVSRSKEVPDTIRKMAEKLYKARRP